MVLFCVADHALGIVQIFHHRYTDTGNPVGTSQADRPLQMLFLIDEKDSAVLHGNADLLTHQCGHQRVHCDTEADGRRILTELCHQVVIASAGYDAVACSVGIALEDNTRVVTVISKHTEIEGNILIHTIGLHQFIDLLQSGDGGQRKRILCQAAGLREDLLRGSE